MEIMSDLLVNYIGNKLATNKCENIFSSHINIKKEYERDVYHPPAFSTYTQKILLKMLKN